MASPRTPPAGPGSPAVEEERLAFSRFDVEHVAGQNQVVAAVDQVTELAGDPEDGARQSGQLAALRPLDGLPLLRLRALAGEATRELLLTGGQCVDAEAPLGTNRGQRARAPVEAGQHHRRVERQGGDRVGGRP